jgi:uncharacterized protein YlxW (UPF0749 family)
MADDGEDGDGLMERNGNRLIYWIMGVMFAILMVLAGGATAAFNSRVDKLEMAKDSLAIEVVSLRQELQRAREDICRLQDSVNDLREEVTHRNIYRRPCP